MTNKLASELTAITAANVDKTADFAVVHDTSVSELKSLTIAEYGQLAMPGVFDASKYGTAGTQAAIVAAIAAASAAGGGDVYIPPGIWTISSSIELVNGVNLRGIFPGPTYDGLTPNFCAGAVMDLAAGVGTVLQASTAGITCFTNNVTDRADPADSLPPISCNISNLGFLDFETCISSGGQNQYGFGYCTIQDIRIDTTSDWAFILHNFQGLGLHRIFGTELKRSIHAIQWHADCQNGNSVWTDLFFDIEYDVEEDESLLFECLYDAGGTDEGNAFNFITILRPQVNQFGTTGTSNASNATVRLRGETSDVNYADSSGSTALTFNTGTSKVELTKHKVTNGTRLVFTEVTTLPIGITAGTTYYAVNVEANAFQVSATKGGSAITLSGSPSADNTCTNPGNAQINQFKFYDCDFEGPAERVIDLSHVLNSRFMIAQLAETAQVDSEHIRSRRGLTNAFHCEVENIEVDIDDIRYMWFGNIGTVSDKYPQGGVARNASADTVTIFGTGSGGQVFNNAKRAFEPQVTASDTWNSQGNNPVYYENRTTAATISKNNMGCTRFSGATTVQCDLPSVQTVAVGCTHYVFNDGSGTITVAKNGSDTINGANQTLSVGAAQVAIMIADNRSSRVNWIGFVVAVTDS